MTKTIVKFPLKESYELHIKEGKYSPSLMFRKIIMKKIGKDSEASVEKSLDFYLSLNEFTSLCEKEEVLDRAVEALKSFLEERSPTHRKKSNLWIER